MDEVLGRQLCNYFKGQTVEVNVFIIMLRSDYQIRYGFPTLFLCACDVVDRLEMLRNFEKRVRGREKNFFVIPT